MEFSLARDAHDGFPVIIASGPISEESLVALGQFIRKSCEEADVQGAIIDCQLIEGALSSKSLYRATPEFALAVGQQIKVAYINRPAVWPPDDDQFSRDLAYNRGVPLEVFESLGDASDWLQQP